MSRKDYVVAATFLSERRMTTLTDAWVLAMETMIEIFTKDKPTGFDPERFREACYV